MSVIREARNKSDARRVSEALEKEFGTSISEDQSEETLIKAPKKASFPALMLAIAIVKDLVDFADFSGVGAVFVYGSAAIFWTSYFIYIFRKVGYMRKLLFKRMAWPIVLFFAANIFPWLRVISMEFLLILLGHYHEKRIVKKFWETLESIDRYVGVDFSSEENVMAVRSKRFGKGRGLNVIGREENSDRWRRANQ